MYAPVLSSTAAWFFFVFLVRCWSHWSKTFATVWRSYTDGIFPLRKGRIKQELFCCLTISQLRSLTCQISKHNKHISNILQIYLLKECVANLVLRLHCLGSCPWQRLDAVIKNTGINSASHETSQLILEFDLFFMCCTGDGCFSTNFSRIPWNITIWGNMFHVL